MKRLLRIVARLYPRAWRKRYGEEFDALLDQTSPKWIDAWDIGMEVLAMRMRSFVVAATVGAVLGALAGGVISRHRDRYIAGAVMAITVPESDSAEENAHAVKTLAEVALTPKALAGMAASHHLYNSERPGSTPEQVVRRFRENIQLAPVATNPHEFTVAFYGANPAEAADVRTDLIHSLVEGNLRSPIRSTVEYIGVLPVMPGTRPGRLVALWTGLGLTLGLLITWLRPARPQAA